MGDLWKVHAFREGNTRTTMLFFNQFANEKGFPLDYELISNNSDYVRNALVAISAVFSDLGDRSQPEHLIRIVKDSMERGA
jgi:cell filamentation protein